MKNYRNSALKKSIPLASMALLLPLMGCRPLTTAASSLFGIGNTQLVYAFTLQSSPSAPDQVQMNFQPTQGAISGYKVTSLSLIMPAAISQPVNLNLAPGTNSVPLVVSSGQQNSNGFQINLVASINGNTLTCNDTTSTPVVNAGPSNVKCMGPAPGSGGGNGSGSSGSGSSGSGSSGSGSSGSGSSGSGGASSPFGSFVAPDEISGNPDANKVWIDLAAACTSSPGNVLAGGSNQVLVGCYCSVAGNQLSFSTYYASNSNNDANSVPKFKTDCSTANNDPSTLHAKLVYECDSNPVGATYELVSDTCSCNSQPNKSLDFKTYYAMADDPVGSFTNALNNACSSPPPAPK